MVKYSGNYVNANYNFTIQNLKAKKIGKQDHAIICVLKNILFRGCPTKLSQKLIDTFGDLQQDIRFKDRVPLVDSQMPIWDHTIKGNAQNNDNPALFFFETVIPQYIDYPSYFRQILLPEAMISDIVEDVGNKFYNRQVDFYCPQVQLVIEIDGGQHQEELNSIEDKERVSFLESHGIKVVRISTEDIRKGSKTLENKMNEINKRIKQYEKLLRYYEKSYHYQCSTEKDDYIEKIYSLTAVFRYQILLLSLLENGMLKLKDKVWKLRILNHESINIEKIAFNDLILWVDHLAKLMKIPFSAPKLQIQYVQDINEFINDEYINIDFSIQKRWTDIADLNSNIVFVRTDYFDKNNYFEVSISDPINYKVVTEGIDNDIPSLEFILENIFGFKQFKPGQLPIIINTLNGKDTLGILPTGSGKSLCYQMCSLLQPCISFVVCPIKSLMYDQRANMLKAKIIRNNFITSDQDGEEKEKIMDLFMNGKYQFIWISPERFQSKKFIDRIRVINERKTIALAVIDEVHCLSEWGHDFRTSYLCLIPTIRKNCPTANFIGLTATASAFVLRDLKNEFDIDSSNIKTLTKFSRDELNFHVHTVDGEAKKKRELELFNILDELDNRDGVFQAHDDFIKSGLIFTLFKTGASGEYSGAF